MSKLTARELLSVDPELLWKIPYQNYDITYEDGVTLSETLPQMVLNRHFWEYFKVMDTPIISCISISQVIGDGFLNRGTCKQVLEAIFQYMCKYHNLRSYDSKQSLTRMTFPIANNIYNNVIHDIGEYVTLANAEAYVDLVDTPEITALHQAMEASPESIEATYKGINNFVRTTKMKSDLILINRAGVANISQYNQVVGPRGYVTDLDRSVFPRPILSGYTKGLNTLYELIIESRTAAKALAATGDSIRKSEYASRRFQILTMSLERAIFGDCGSTGYMGIFVTKQLLPNMKGLWRLDETNNTLHEIDGTETELIDTLIKTRSIFHCTLEDHSTVCSVCAGSLVENFPSNTNLGHLCSSDRGEKTTQGILSIKHNVASVAGSALVLEDRTLDFFTFNEASELMIRNDVDLDGMYLVLDSTKLYKLIDAISTNLKTIPMFKIGEIDYIGLQTQDEKFKELLCVSSGDRQANITRELLEHIRDSDHSFDQRNNYVIPLKGWDCTKPMFKIELKDTDVTAYITRFSNMVEGTKDKKLSFMDHFYKLVDITLERGNCNLTILQVMAYAISVYDPENNDYRLGRNAPSLQFSDKMTIFNNRSMGQFLIYEKQMGNMLKYPEVIFGKRKRESHPTDVYVMPQEVVDRYLARKPIELSY